MDGTLPEVKVRPQGLPPTVPPAVRGSLSSRRAVSTAPNATLMERRDETAQVATFLVRPDDPTMTHRPGQYATLGLEVNGAAISRPYSMASLPGGATWEFHIRRVRDGAFTPRLFDLPIGARLRLGPSKGLFVLDADDARPHLFMATGTGIAPFVAMLRAEIASGAPRPVTLIHGAAHADELGYAELLRDWERQGAPLRYVPTISRPADRRNDGWRWLTGRAEEVLARDWTHLGLDPSQTVVYLCGNPGMVTTAEGTLLAGGFPVASVRREAYWLDRTEGSPAGPAA